MASNVIDIKKEVSELVELWSKQNQLLKEASVLANQYGQNIPKRPSDNTNGRAKGVANLTAIQKEQLRVEQQLESVNAKIAIANDKNTQTLAEQRTVLKSLNGAYAELTEKHKKASITLRDLVAQGVKAGQTQKQYNRELANAKREYDQLDAKVVKANRSINRFNDNVGNYPKLAGGIRDLMGAFGVATGIYLAVDIGKNILNTTRELQSLDLALKNVTETQSNFAEQQAFIGATAEKYGLEINSLTKQFTQFYVSAKDKLANTEIQQIFEDTASAVSALGLPLENQEKAFYAMNQMMSKGTVQAEELRGQLGDAMPGAFKAMVKAYNELHPKQQVTEAQFAGLMKKGQILANEILPEFAKQLKNATGGEAGAQISTLNKEINKLSNEWVLFVRSLNSGKNELGGFFSWFIGEARFALKWWREFFDEYNVSWKNILLPTMLLEKDMYRQREKQLNGIFETNKKTSQASLKYMTDEIQKQKYITDGLKTHNAEIKKLQEEYKKAKEINKTINVRGRFDKGLYSAENKEQFEQYKTNKARMSEIAEQISARKGLIAGLTIANKTSSEEEVKGDEKVKKSKKEKIDLTFKEIDSLYQLRKAQAEARIDQSADDESKTFQERLILLKEHTDAKISENELYYDHETALALKQYHDDLKRNNDAFREKGINATEHAENIKDINSTLNNTLNRLDLERGEKVKYILKGGADATTQMANEQKRITFEMNQLILKNEQEKYKAISDNERYSMTARQEAFKHWLSLEQKRLEAEKTLKLAQEQDPLKKDAITQEYDLLIAKLGEMETPLAKFKKQLNDAFESDALQTMNKQLQELGATSLSKLLDFTVSADGKIESTFMRTAEALKGSGQEWALYAGTIIGVMQDAYNLINQSNQAYFDEQRSRAEAQYEYQLQFVTGNVEAEKQLADDLAKRKKEIANQEAKAKKEQTIFNIIMNTAQGVTSALASTKGLVMALVIGALGAAQLAMVASQNTPQYAKGRKGGKAELAITDERGAEIHTDKYGNIKDYGSDKGARYKWLAEGDKIYTAEETMRYQKAFAESVSSPKQIFSSQNTTTTIIREQIPTQEVSVNIDKNGINTTIRNISKTAEVQNNYYRIKGFKA
jgi:tape measure domain-containing protein